MRRRLLLVAVAVVCVAALVAGGVFLVGRATDDENSPAETAESYLAAWEDQRWDDMAVLVRRPPDDFADVHEQTVDRLAVTSSTYRGDRVQRAGEAETAVVPFTATLTLAGLGEWSYESQLRVVKVTDTWQVDWDMGVLHPSLQPGHELRRVRERPERAPILGHDGTQLSGPVEVVEVGVQPSRIDDRDELLGVLAEHLDVDPARVEADLDRSGVQPDWFIPVKRLRLDEYAAVEDDIHPVPGTVFRRVTTRLPPVDGFAAHLLGRAGEITAELLDELGEPYVRHDVVGLSGLERAFEEQLGGLPSGEVQLVDGDGEVVEVLHRFEGAQPEPLTTTIDKDIQMAAEHAAAGVDGPAAIVAVDPASGGVRAVVSRPLGEFNRALSGRYPPGSTFKVITASAALDAAVTPEENFDCREQVRVGGRVFRNAGGEARGELSFRDSFAHSCNTVFAPLGARLGSETLAAAARDFGFGETYHEEFPLPAFGGAFPEPRDDAEEAAAAIGQARVQASPLHMATVAAAVAGGGWRPPQLLGGDLPPPAESLAPETAATLRELMEVVVTNGTGTAAAVAGRTIAGKTGTAEFDRGDPPPAHAWFIGHDAEADVAVAVLVEGGGSGGEVAAPIAARFFSTLSNLRQ